MPAIRLTIVVAVVGILATGAMAAPPSKDIPVPRPRPAGKAAAKATAVTKPPAHKPGGGNPLAIAPAAGSVVPASVSSIPASGVLQEPGSPSLRSAPPLRPTLPFATTTSTSTSPLDLSAVKQVLELVRKNRQDEATDVENTISDPVARKVVEWAILRSDTGSNDFSRYAAFIAANPSWPSVTTLRRRAEGVLWQERTDAQTTIAFFASDPPHTAKGHFAYARALLTQGNTGAAMATIRETWRNDGFSADLEAQARDAFAGLITPADDARAHGRAPLCRGRRRRLARGAASRRHRRCRRQGARRGHQPIRQGQSAA